MPAQTIKNAIEKEYSSASALSNLKSSWSNSELNNKINQKSQIRFKKQNSYKKTSEGFLIPQYDLKPIPEKLNSFSICSAKEKIEKSQEFRNSEKIRRSNLPKAERLKERLSECPSMPWGMPVCKDCNTPLLKKPIKLSCLSPYCSDSECLKNRVKFSNSRFKDFNIHSKKLYHQVIGRKNISLSELNSDQRDITRKAFLEVLKLTQKAYGRLYYAGAMDINLKQNNNVRLHAHIGFLPLKDFKKFNSCLDLACRKVSKKYGFPISWSGGKYQKTRAVLSYLSKRIAGDFGHNRTKDGEKEEKFGYSDFISVEDYCSIFYKKRNMFSNLRHRTRKGAGFIEMIDNSLPKTCPNCAKPTKNNICFLTLEEIGSIQPPPPPETFEILNIECIKIA